MTRNKKTKIVATISDLRCSKELIETLYNAGMDVVRVNSAHVTEESASIVVKNVHAVNPAIPVMIDTKGPEIRVTSVADEYKGGIDFTAGQTVEVRGTDSGEKCTSKVIYMNVPSIVNDVELGNRMLIADGKLEIEVIEKYDDHLVCKFLSGGNFRSRKSVNVPGVSIELPSITEKDRRFILWAINNDVDFIAHSFVRSAADVRAVQDILDEHNSPIKIISKIENQEGIDNIDEIIEASYGIMVARGDLGVELPPERIPRVQHMIVQKCIAAKRPVIIATQMLYSMVNAPRPTRAEVTDVAGAVYEKVDAVMLSDETAMGDYPKESVETMSRIIREVESDEDRFTPMVDINMASVNHEITAQLARSAVRATTNLPIKYVVIDTETGRTGRYLAAFRGNKFVIAVCYTQHAQRILALSYGVVAILRTQAERKYHFVVDALDFVNSYEKIEDKDLIAIVGGSFGIGRGGSYVEFATAAEFRSEFDNAK
ncbi:MAG: pyruvate kinase [Rikenellaceae bacterium]